MNGPYDPIRPGPLNRQTAATLEARIARLESLLGAAVDNSSAVLCREAAGWWIEPDAPDNFWVQVTSAISPLTTTIALAITAGTAVTVTPASMLGIFVDVPVTVTNGATTEVVTPTAVTATTFTADFHSSYGVGTVVTGMVSAGSYSWSQVVRDTPVSWATDPSGLAGDNGVISGLPSYPLREVNSVPLPVGAVARAWWSEADAEFLCAFAAAGLLYARATTTTPTSGRWSATLYTYDPATDTFTAGAADAVWLTVANVNATPDAFDVETTVYYEVALVGTANGRPVYLTEFGPAAVDNTWIAANPTLYPGPTHGQPGYVSTDTQTLVGTKTVYGWVQSSGGKFRCLNNYARGDADPLFTWLYTDSANHVYSTGPSGAGIQIYHNGDAGNGHTHGLDLTAFDDHNGYTALVRLLPNNGTALGPQIQFNSASVSTAAPAVTLGIWDGAALQPGFTGTGGAGDTFQGGLCLTAGGGGGGSGTVTSVATSGSLTGGAITTTGTLSLVNDNAAPGNRYYYGTDLSGIKGFFELPLKASTNLLSVTAAQNPVATYTDAGISDGTYRVGAYVNITAVVTDVLQLQVTYTDQNSVGQTVTLYPVGSASANLALVQVYTFPVITIRVKMGTAITVLTILSVGGGTIAYDAGATIEYVV